MIFQAPCAHATFLDGDDLCLFFKDPSKIKNGVSDGTQFALCYFAKGQNDGIKIPLAFGLQLIKNSSLTRYQPPGGEPQATTQGLVFAQPMVGFWFIPWSDIDAYRAKVPAPSASVSPDSAH